jgi:large subunit ribosomal protein L11
MSLVRHVKLRVPAGAARPGPAIGQALGPLGINMADFCKQFNDKTESMGYEKETPLTVQLSAKSDRTFDFDVRSPPTSYLVKKAAGIDRGPDSPNADAPVGFITPEAVYEIARVKNADQHRWHLPLDGVARSVIGTARSMGIRVKESEDDQVVEEVGAAKGAEGSKDKKGKDKKGKKKK